MVFTIPPYETLVEAGQALESTYKKKREAKDADRFFGGYRSATKNPSRDVDIHFAKTITCSADKRRPNYAQWDEEIQKQSAEKSKNQMKKIVADYLELVMTGAFLLDLTFITKEFYSEESVKGSSVLGELILDLFQIEKLSDAPEETRLEVFQALKHYMTVVNNKTVEPIKWHETKSNKALMEALDHEICKVETSALLELLG